MGRPSDGPPFPIYRPFDGSLFRRVALPMGRPPCESQRGPSEREAEDAPGAPLLGAASRHAALPGSQIVEKGGGEYNRFTVLDAIESSKQNALSAKTIILSDSQGHASTIRIGIRYTRRL